jgi:uncharacterized ubiquitin-like protein YukD
MNNMPQGQPLDAEGSASRQYKKKKQWCLRLNVTIETPSLDNKHNETLEIEIPGNQRLKILQQTILAEVTSPQVRELFKNEKMFIYIDGKHPVHRKSKSLQEMGVKDGDNLICTTEMRLPLHDDQSDDEDVPPQPADQRPMPPQMQIGQPPQNRPPFAMAPQHPNLPAMPHGENYRHMQPGMPNQHFPPKQGIPMGHPMHPMGGMHMMPGPPPHMQGRPMPQYHPNMMMGPNG